VLFDFRGKARAVIGYGDLNDFSSRTAVVIKFAALAAIHRIEPSGFGDKRVALAAEIMTFETALDNHGKSRSKKREDWIRNFDAVSCRQSAPPAAP
jgi:hypothetical protein